MNNTGLGNKKADFRYFNVFREFMPLSNPNE
jgi:hypothetical protein